MDSYINSQKLPSNSHSQVTTLMTNTAIKNPLNNGFTGNEENNIGKTANASSDLSHMTKKSSHFHPTD